MNTCDYGGVIKLDYHRQRWKEQLNFQINKGGKGMYRNSTKLTRIRIGEKKGNDKVKTVKSSYPKRIKQAYQLLG